MVLILGVSGWLDYELELGKFHGLVFYLWSLYGCGILFIVNSLIALVYIFKSQWKKAKPIFLAGLLVSGVTALLLFFSAHLIQNNA